MTGQRGGRSLSAIVCGAGPATAIGSFITLAHDRSFVSELVYGPLDRGRSRLTFDQAARLAAAAVQRDGVLVHLTGRPEQIAARLLARDGNAPALPRLRALTAAYTDVFTRLADHAPVITIDTTAGAA